MPIYEYQCETCEKVHEVLQKMSDSPLVDCPECAGKLQKRISQCSFHLKGSGWYVTDYANSAGKTASSPENKDKQSKTDAKETSSTGDGAGSSADKPADSTSA